DLTGPLGFLTGKIFGDLGADVIKIELPGGDAARRMPPLLQNGNGSQQSLYWLACNAKKRSINVVVMGGAGGQVFPRLARRSDFVIETRGAYTVSLVGHKQMEQGSPQTDGLRYETLRDENPGLILVSISPFGSEGPYQDLQGSDLEIMALSGAMSLAGEKDGEPMRVSVPQAPMWAGAEAAMVALTALAYRTTTGRGQ